ncbi:MAG: UDP-2,3-diacylglucosamine diphosphatase [Methylococcaceae bacterium]|nr:UDP-2,3-diacylglucosamine diphosphatase [Methylococcaceae bacterium]
MKTEILFISDLHLSIDKPELTRRFIDFLTQRAPKAAKVYILGDLFDAWVGDDDWTPPTRHIRQQLKQLIQSGTEIYLQTGNRDFLLGERFCRETGVQLLGDYAVLNLNDVATLLTHGDLLCTDDIAYQQFRIKARSLAWQQSILSKPLSLRLLAARWYRLRSYWHKRNKTSDIMDVNQETVAQIMLTHRVQRLIHGHTHRPAVHDFILDGKPAQRFVLAQWHPKQIEILSWTAQGYQLEALT